MKIHLTKGQKIILLAFILGYIISSLFLWIAGSFVWLDLNKQEVYRLPIYYAFYPLSKKVSPEFIFLFYGHPE